MGRSYRTVLLFILGVFGAMYASISLVDHWLFRTYALDLGLYTNAAWKYGRFTLPDRSMFREDTDPLLADHFDLHLMLWSPLTWIFGEWTLLLVQIAAVLVGAIGMYRLVMELTKDVHLGSLAMLSMLLFFSVFTAMAFDFHSNVVACMAVPWWFYFLRKGRYPMSWIVMFFIVSGKENLGIWFGIVCFAGMGVRFLENVPRKLLFMQGVVAMAWAIVAIVVIMPALDSSGNYHQMMKYSVLGENWGEMLSNMVREPLRLLAAVVSDIQGKHPLGDAIKLEFYCVLLVAGGWSLLARWPFLIMALPLILQKMLHDDPSKWGLFGQYSIEFAVLVPISLFATIGMIEGKWRSRVAAIVSTALIGIATCYVLYQPVEHADPNHGDHDRLRFFSKKHYEPYLDQEAAFEALSRIPDEAVACAVSPFVPHLVRRTKLYQFPFVQDAEYVLIVRNAVQWPLSVEEYAAKITEFEQGQEWEKKFEASNIMIFKRRSTASGALQSTFKDRSDLP